MHKPYQPGYPLFLIWMWRLPIVGQAFHHTNQIRQLSQTETAIAIQDSHNKPSRWRQEQVPRATKLNTTEDKSAISQCWMWILSLNSSLSDYSSFSRASLAWDFLAFCRYMVPEVINSAKSFSSKMSPW